MKCTSGFVVSCCLTLTSVILVTLTGICLLTAHAGVHVVRRERGQQWAVLVAGSRGWENYRHQADLCHAYQVLHAHGIPEDNIIVMMYDDIAYAKENPTPGMIINHPNGTDVYKGVPKDYVCSTVRPDVFLKVDILMGKCLGLKSFSPNRF